ncbi:hypothetical protein HPB52_002510 [Rhipicephalus sanguineus]|uniref:Uncharacterized protein n=1 Tax=Rhipicephalus sanguineus TaxID=34632 RepID=A0A9D4SRT7_RHISA|nr:hypothetical protein HPB52_002510 [Rhipicephalus sanguineus]
MVADLYGEGNEAFSNSPSHPSIATSPSAPGERSTPPHHHVYTERTHVVQRVHREGLSFPLAPRRRQRRCSHAPSPFELTAARRHTMVFTVRATAAPHQHQMVHPVLCCTFKRAMRLLSSALLLIFVTPSEVEAQLDCNAPTVENNIKIFTGLANAARIQDILAGASAQTPRLRLTSPALVRKDMLGNAAQGDDDDGVSWELMKDDVYRRAGGGVSAVTAVREDDEDNDSARRT